MHRLTRLSRNRLGIVIVATVVPCCAQGPMEHLPDLITIFGQVTVDGGGPPPVNANVEAGCTGGNNWSGYTDKDGKFAFSAAVPWHDPFAVCNIIATAPGFRTARVRISAPENRVAVLTLHRIDPDEGTTVSLVSLNAPAGARKELAKGNAALAGRKWRQAQVHFEAAVAAYPQYAEAWCNLGIAHRAQNETGKAREAWQQAIAADPKYVRPYLEWAALAADEGKWAEAAGIAERGVRLKPADAPGIYYYHACANHALRNFDEAERSAQRAIELDVHDGLPRAHYILALALAQRGEYRTALEHMRLYLERAPKANEADLVKKQIAELERAVTR